MRRDRERGFRRDIKGEIKEVKEEVEERMRYRKSWGGTEREVIEGKERRR